MQMQPPRSSLLLLLCLTSCPESRPPSDEVEQKKRLTVVTSFGNPVAGTQVQVWGNQERTILLDEAATDEDGRAELELYRKNEPVWVRTEPGSGGRFVDMATDTTVDLRVGLHALVEVSELGGEVALSPRTTEAVIIAETISRQFGSFTDAWHEAVHELNALYDCLQTGYDLVRAIPASADSPAEHRTQAAMARFGLGGMSEQARMISKAYGSGVNVQDLWEASLQDVSSDLLWDGLGPDGPIAVGGYELSPSTLRWANLGYAQGLRAWPRSHHYTGGLTDEDALPLATCIAQARGRYFPEGPVGQPDFSGPVIQFVTPSPSTFIHGDSVPVVVTAEDPAGMVGFALDAVDGLRVQMLDLHSSPARFQASLDSGRHVDGSPIQLAATATDKLGNTARETREVYVLNEVPAPEVLLVPDDDTVRHRVNVGCNCAVDFPASVDCLLVYPDPDTENVEEVSRSDSRVMYSWQSVQEPEGAHTLTCHAAIAGLDRIAEDSRPVTVDNIAASSYCGMAPPGSEGRVVPFGMPDNLLATAQVDDNGTFCLEVDYPAGPIVLEFVGRTAQLQRFVKPQSIALGNNKLALYLHHEPGVHIDGLTPDGLTSLATALCRGLYDEAADTASHRKTDTKALCDDVHQTLNSYALADQADGSDIRWSAMAPWNGSAQSAPRDAQYKLLWHAAVDYLAEKIGISWIDIVMHGVDDARADAFLDGRGASGTPIAVRQQTLDGMTFRSALGRAGLRLTRGVPLDELQVDVPAGLTEEAFVDYWTHLARFESLYFVRPNRCQKA
jgi:hypothetical protein